MLTALTIVLPVFLVTVLGFVLARRGVFTEPAIQGLMDFVWYLAIPALLFGSFADKALPGGSEMLLVAAYYGSVLLAYALVLFVVGPLLKLTFPERGAMAFAVIFGNSGIIGLAIVGQAFGDEGLRLILILIAFHAPVLVTLTTLVVEGSRGGDASPVDVLRGTSARLLRHPVLLTLAISVSWSAAGIPVPEVLKSLVTLLGNAVAPCGLFAVGATMARFRLEGAVTSITVMALIKLVIFPSIVYAVATYVFQLPPTWVAVATVMAAMPAGIISFAFAQSNGLIVRRVASNFLVTTGLSVVTLTLLLMAVTPH